MTCEQAREQLGAYLDGELSADAQQGVAAHLVSCEACREELKELRLLVSELASAGPVTVPGALWPATEQRLGDELGPLRRPRGRWMQGHPFAVAAGIVLVVGLGTIMFTWPGEGVGSAEAATVNFKIILDMLPLDAEGAFRKFLVLYEAQEFPADQAREYAPHLNFGLPDTLHGGFRLGPVYGLRFGREAGIAAKYTREGEFLVAIFHPTVHKEDHGTHADYPCVIGEHCGQRVKVGEWSLVHVTVPTTCHCILSRLDEETELPPVLSALAPAP